MQPSGLRDTTRLLPGLKAGVSDVGKSVMNKAVFLDLEETIIESWHNPLLCNVDKIREILRNEETEDIHIFSFAISDNRDKQIFKERLKPFIEEVLGVRIITWPSVEEIRQEVLSFNNVVFDPLELITVWGKLRAFHDFCQNKFENTECVLLDDVVPNSTFHLHEQNLIIRSIRV